MGLWPAGEAPTSPKGGWAGKENCKDRTMLDDCACCRNERQLQMSSHNGNCFASESTVAGRSTAAFERVGRFGRWQSLAPAATYILRLTPAEGVVGRGHPGHPDPRGQLEPPH